MTFLGEVVPLVKNLCPISIPRRSPGGKMVLGVLVIAFYFISNNVLTAYTVPYIMRYQSKSERKLL